MTLNTVIDSPDDRFRWKWWEWLAPVGVCVVCVAFMVWL